MERKKAANRLVVDEAVNDDNSVVALHPDTMEKLQLFRGDTILIKVNNSCVLLFKRIKFNYLDDIFWFFVISVWFWFAKLILIWVLFDCRGLLI